MLVLSRKRNEQIVIDGRITITVVTLGPNRVKLGIDCSPEIPVHRKEIHDLLDAEARFGHKVDLIGCP